MTASEVATNRYQKFKEILKHAAAGSASDYGTLGPFWELSLERLLDANLYSVRLIAQEETKHSCCSHMPAASPESRSARFGLIQGLLGAPFFDRLPLPRLPRRRKRRQARRHRHDRRLDR